MVLIFSQSDDISTTDVIKWLLFYNQTFLRININSDLVKLVFVSIEHNEIIIQINEQEVFNLCDFKFVWYRRGGFSFFIEGLTYKLINDAFGNDKELENHIKYNLNNEKKVIADFIHYTLEKKIKIGSKFNSSLNKLIVLSKAKECGIKIPPTSIVSNKNQLKGLKVNNKNQGIISKAISEGVYLFSKNKSYYTYTEEIKTSSSKLPKVFFPTLIQSKIDKKYELRIFYLKESFYSMAIFSQNDDKTKVDFRKYNQKNPNRKVPFTLPKSIMKKLNKLMKNLNLDTGSIDMIVDNNNDYIFLEINPVGQFQMTSIPCNYYLEKKIAECLI